MTSNKGHDPRVIEDLPQCVSLVIARSPDIDIISVSHTRMSAEFCKVN